jgi:FKBP-type peptidyl-prolyl cis-trans isomerase FklB
MRPLYLGIFIFAIMLIVGGSVVSTYRESQQARRGPAQMQENLKNSNDFLAENAKKEGVVTRPSGLQYIVLQEGKGKQPSATDSVEVHYRGTLIDGTVFDSSIDRGQPLQSPVNKLIPGWTEALQCMKEGTKWRIFVPPKLAYGAGGTRDGRIGPNQALIFEVELLRVGPVAGRD